MQRLNDLHRDGRDLRIHPLRMQDAGGKDRALPPGVQHRKCRVDDVQMRVNAHGGGEKQRAIGGLAIEEVAVIEIAVGAGDGHRFRCLVDRIIVALGQHLRILACRQPGAS